jgi:type II secretory pathway pseudopilin PulG
MCSYPLGCTEYAAKGSDRCSNHQIKKGEGKIEKKAVTKALADRQAAAALAAERARRDVEATKAAAAQQAALAAQQTVMRTHRAAWNTQIDAVVAQVLVLRATDPNANAGNNAVGNTAGGTGNPVALNTTGPMAGVTKGDILQTMAGFDSSDSGLYKFRRSLVLVHCS